MFEAVFAFCLAGSDGPCRDQLLPGYEAATQTACMAALAADPPVIAVEARCRPLGEALDFVEVAPGAFAHLGRVEEPDGTNRGDVSNIGFVVGETAVAVIDSGTARWMGEAIWRAVRSKTDLPISHVILTHMHPDHVLGAAPLAEAGAQVVGHASLPRALADRQANYIESLSRLIGSPHFLGTETTPVNIEVADRLEIDLGDRVLTVQAWPRAHTGSDVTIHDPATGTLFAGDLVFHRHTPALDGRLLGWRAVLAEMEDLPLERVVPGHGGPSLPWPDGARDLQRYLGVLESDTRAAVERGMRLGTAVEQIAAEEATNWELFEAYNKRNATVAFTELEWE